MRINRVYLENYRIHESLEIEFSKGINLLLGENGKGKSSILEAIGYALFDSGLRTNNQKEAIKYGKKSAKIEVDFTGIDNEDYKVVRRIPGGTQLFKGEEVLEGRIEKVRELCGIKGDIKDIYDNVIVAKQNEFILAFKEKATDREKIFNRVFNTDIYTKIYEGFSREASSKYERELDLMNNNVLNISETLINSKEIEEKLEFLNENLKVQKEYEEVLEKKTLQVKEELREVNTLEINIRQLELTEENLKQNIISRESDKKETQRLIDESIKASKIVEENKSGYERYQILDKELEEIKERKKEIELARDEYQKNERKKSNLEYELSQILGEKEVLFNRMENNKENLLEKERRVDSLREEKNIKESQGSEYKKEVERLNPILTYSLEMEEKLLQASQALEKQKEKIFEKKEELEKYLQEEKNLEEKNLEKRLEELSEKEKNLRELEGRNRILQTQKLENKEAFELLKSAVCPYLKESCENLKGRDVSEFFQEKLTKIDEELENNREKIEKLKSILKDKEKVQNEFYRYEDIKKSLGEKKSELEKESLRLENWEIRYQLGEKQYQEYREKERFSDSEELKKIKVSYETKLNTLEIDKYIREIEKLEKEKGDIVKELEKISLLVEDIDRKKIELEKSIEEVRLYLDERKNIEERFREVNSKVERKEIELKEIERAKELYIENYKKSLEKERYISNLEKLEESIKFEEKNLESLLSTLESEKEKLSKCNKEELSRREEELNEEFKTLRGKLGELGIEISHQQEKLQEAKKREERLKEEKKKIERLKLKIQLTKSFREKIKNMGKEVSKSMLKEIEILATENFRKITGRGEKIIWSNEDRDRYSVYLFGDRGELKFEQLSGGEQVAVAISIRGAMSELFTDSKFSIFDEPTNNLDSERRRSLADSIGEILKNLDQSIIVTHDDTFREMAERVIEL